MRLYNDDMTNVYGSKRNKTNTRKPLVMLPDEQREKILSESTEGTWIYSFADLVMNLLMFFMMMFAISSIDAEKLKAVKQAISTQFKNQVQSEAQNIASHTATTNRQSNRELLQSATETLSKLDQDQLKREKNEHVTFTNLEVNIVELRKVIGLGVALDPERDVFDVVFAANRLFNARNELTPEGQRLLRRLSAELENTKARLVINVQAHTSPSNASKRTTDSGDAFRVTSKRATEVLFALKRGGLSETHSLSMAAFGSLMPLLPKSSQLNERVVVRVGRAVPRPDPKIFMDQTK